MVGYCVYVAVAQLFLQSVSGSDGVRSAGGIMIYILTMFLVGMNEEVIMRGIVLNLFADRFSNTRRGVLAAIILSSVIFGAAHIPNVLSDAFRCAIIQRIDPGTAGNIARCAVCSNLSAQRKFMDLYHYSCTC